MCRSADLFHARINSRSGGGAAGADPAQQQLRVEVPVRLDGRLPALGGGRSALQVPKVSINSAYGVFHSGQAYQGVGRGARPAAEPISEGNRFSKLHCGRCMKPLSEGASTRHAKAVNEGATYWVYWKCDEELRARGGQDSKAWRCPTALDGNSGCLCTSDKPKQAAPSFKRNASRRSFIPPKKRKWEALTKNNCREGDQ